MAAPPTPTVQDADSRRGFMLSTALAATAAAAGLSRAAGAAPEAAALQDTAQNAAAASTNITAATFAEAEKLAGIRFTAAERTQMQRTIGEHVEGLRARLAIAPLPGGLAPATIFRPLESPLHRPMQEGDPAALIDQAPPIPTDPVAIAFAPVTWLAQWLRRREITSIELTQLALDRLKKHDAALTCVVTLTEQRALRMARRADRDFAEGRVRSPLQGIPWGAKDLLDTAGIATTWGAAPYRGREPEHDAAVVQRLDDAGAVLVAKLSLGALAYGDLWYGGRTKNPWRLDQGSSGSSAGPAAATAAGLVPFSIGSETYGSIVSPCMRCGTVGLRPTFGRVSRTGAMALCWSLDKLGPITRTVSDAVLVLAAINGGDSGDPASVDRPFHADLAAPTNGMRLGYDPAWFEGRGASDADRAALQAAIDAGCVPVPVSLPDLPWSALLAILTAEASAAFESLTRHDLDDQLAWQDDVAWPNTFRQAWFIPAPELLQVERFRRRVMEVMAAAFTGVDAMISPSFAASLLLITNNTGHPSVTLRTGYRPDGTPRGTTLWGQLFDEGTLCTIGHAIERKLDIWHDRPPLD